MTTTAAEPNAISPEMLRDMAAAVGVSLTDEPRGHARAPGGAALRPAPPSRCDCRTRAPSPRRSSASIAGRDRAVTEPLREDLCDLPLLDVAEKIRTRQISPVDVTERVLARIDASTTP